ncbi:hypothetical protein ACLOJK_008669 [Asimina triloba]
MANPKILNGRCTHSVVAHQIGSCGEQSPKSIGHLILYTTPISSPTASIFHHHRRMPKSSRPPSASSAAEDGLAPSNRRSEQPCLDPADAPATIHHHGVRLLHNRPAIERGQAVHLPHPVGSGSPLRSGKHLH